MSDAILIASMTALINGVVVWATMRVEIRYMKRDINAAHKRLDKIGAPAAHMDLA